jgi:hypothetical protein
VDDLHVSDPLAEESPKHAFVLSDDAVESAVTAPVSPLSALRAALCLLCGLLLYFLGGLCTKRSSLKVKAALANLNTTASTSSLSLISNVSHCLCYLCLCECPVSFLGDDLLALASGNLCQTWRTSIPITRSSTNILAAGHADKTL